MKFHDLLKNALSGDSIALEKLRLIHRIEKLPYGKAKDRNFQEGDLSDARKSRAVRG